MTNFSPAEERCAPRKVGFASAVDNMVARARAAEKLRENKLPEPELYESSRTEFLEWLEELGVERRAAELSLTNHELVVKVNLLRELAEKYRKLWAPEPCPWVGALEDEAKLLAKEIPGN